LYFVIFTAMTYDFIIIGQGIAGTTLAINLLKENKKILIIDKETNDNASRVAAGLINPITGKKVVKTWLANETFAELHQFYPYAEQLLGSSFFHPQVIYKPYLSTQELNHVFSRSTPGDLGDFVSLESNNQVYKPFIKNNLGGFTITSGGHLDTNTYLNAAEQYFKEKNILVNKAIDYKEITIKPNQVKIGSYTADKIIFCEGLGALNNPFFNYLPFRPNKGEVLTIKSEALDLKDIISKNGWLLPLGNHVFKIGATYENEFETTLPTEANKQILEEKLQEIIKVPYEIIHHQAGVRPANLNRRPFIGQHPTEDKLYIFNGLGSKGVSLAPYFAKQFVQHLLHNTALHPEADIHTHLSLFEANN